MALAGVSEGRRTFRLELPVHRVGNYRATARIRSGGRVRWASEDGHPDLRFRPRDEAFEALNIEIVSVPNANVRAGVTGTLADMMEPGSPLTDGRYTLEWLKGQGKNCVWLLPPFPSSEFPRVSPVDDAVSPYAIKDFFGVRPELARAARGLTAEAARTAAKEELLAFIGRAHALGMRVVIDLPLNHLGWRHELRDLFVSTDGEGREVREVRANDFSSFVELDPSDHAAIEAALRDPRRPKVLEALAPFFYGSRVAGAEPARSALDIAPGGWFEWLDTLQLDHGRRRVAFRAWEDLPVTRARRAVIGWLGRVLRFWAVDMGVDGFRIDHLAGTPLAILEEGLNLMQADVDRHTPGRTILVLGEDFDTPERTAPWVDYLQSGWFRELLAARTPQAIEAIVESPHFCHVHALSSHDEARARVAFGTDARAALRHMTLLHLLGGPLVEVMGDHLGEPFTLPFKQRRGVGALEVVTDEGRELALAIGRVGRLRASLPALERARRAWLRPRLDERSEERRVRNPSPGGELLVLAAPPSPGETSAVLVAMNLDDRSEREDTFLLDAGTLAWLDPEAKYRAEDALSSSPEAALWPEPLTGRDLAARGVFVRLGPYEVQVLRIRAVR